MAAGTPTPTISLSERSLLTDSQPDKLPRWLFLSLLFHGLLVMALFIVPFLPSRRVSAPPVYTVDLVGGEKIGGNRAGTELLPAPAPKQAAKETAPEPPPAPVKKEAKKIDKPEKVEKAKPVEKAVTVPNKPAAKETAKKEPPKKETIAEAKRETKSEESSLDSVRERLIQSA